MCGSMVDIQSAARKKKKERKKPQGENVMACPIPYGGHNKSPLCDIYNSV